MVVVVSREEWEAEPAKESKPLVTPVATVVVFPETDTNICFTKRECIKTMKEIQKQQMNKGYPDIQYNFLVGMDGRIYEGKGWSAQGTNIIYHPELDGKIISIAYIGNFEDWTPPYKMLEALSKFIKEGIKKSYITPDYRRGDIIWRRNELVFYKDCQSSSDKGTAKTTAPEVEKENINKEEQTLSNSKINT